MSVNYYILWIAVPAHLKNITHSRLTLFDVWKKNYCDRNYFFIPTVINSGMWSLMKFLYSYYFLILILDSRHIDKMKLPGENNNVRRMLFVNLLVPVLDNKSLNKLNMVDNGIIRISILNIYKKKNTRKWEHTLSHRGYEFNTYFNNFVNYDLLNYFESFFYE